MENNKKQEVEELLAASQVYQFLSTCLFELDEKMYELVNNKDYLGEVESCLGNCGNGELSETFRLLKMDLQNSDLDVFQRFTHMAANSGSCRYFWLLQGVWARDC